MNISLPDFLIVLLVMTNTALDWVDLQVTDKAVISAIIQRKASVATIAASPTTVQADLSTAVKHETPVAVPPGSSSDRRISLSLATEAEPSTAKPSIAEAVTQLITKQEIEEEILSLLWERMDKQIQLHRETIEALNKNKRMVTAFDWTEAEFGNIYHPDSWVQSLDDTPDFFEAENDLSEKLKPFKQIKTYLKSLTRRDHFEKRKWSLANMKDYIKADDLSFLTFFDISFGSRGRLIRLRSGGRSLGHYDNSEGPRDPRDKVMNSYPAGIFDVLNDSVSGHTQSTNYANSREL